MAELSSITLRYLHSRMCLCFYAKPEDKHFGWDMLSNFFHSLPILPSFEKYKFNIVIPVGDFGMPYAYFDDVDLQGIESPVSVCFIKVDTSASRLQNYAFIFNNQSAIKPTPEELNQLNSKHLLACQYFPFNERSTMQMMLNEYCDSKSDLFCRYLSLDIILSVIIMTGTHKYAYGEKSGETDACKEMICKYRERKLPIFISDNSISDELLANISRCNFNFESYLESRKNLIQDCYHWMNNFFTIAFSTSLQVQPRFESNTIRKIYEEVFMMENFQDIAALLESKIDWNIYSKMSKGIQIGQRSQDEISERITEDIKEDSIRILKTIIP